MSRRIPDINMSDTLSSTVITNRVSAFPVLNALEEFRTLVQLMTERSSQDEKLNEVSLGEKNF